jgi:hypothetical protein
MSFTDKRLCNPTQLTTSGQTLYTVPSSKTSIIKQIVVTNITGSAATFSLYIGSAATPNALFSATSVAANDTIIINLSQVLNSLDILTALASANNSLNITISGVENDGPLNPLSVYIADQAITTNKIADNSIVNAKISNSAAISQSKVENLIPDLASKAPLASPSFSGTPIAPTASAGTNTAQLATTAFVTTAVSNISTGSVPNFLVYLSGGNSTAANGATIAYNSEVYDDTNNVLSGVFTVPAGQAGTYSFTSHQNAYNIGTSGIIRGRIDITGAGIAGAYFGSSAPAAGATDTYVEVSLVIKMAVGDTARCVFSVPATGLYSAGLGYNSFSGVRVA